MMAAHAGLERRVVAALDAAPSRVPVVLGGCGTGRTTLLHALVDRLGRPSCQYIDVERAASTPERFFHAVFTSSPFVDPALPRGEVPTPANARDAFDRTLAFFQRARTPDGQAATFLLDEVLELRTFENFPGLRHVLRELLQAVGDSPNRFVCSSRYVTRALRALRDAASRFEVVHLPPLSVADVAVMLPTSDGASAGERDELAASVQALGDGRAAYVRALGDATAAMSQRGGDPISALTALLTSDGGLTAWCGYRYELRLQRARGYGALKAILEILAEEEPLTLTEISLRMRRTPGSTKDYLSWLEDVDLVVARHKRYSFADPMLRLWVRLHAKPMPPGVDDVAREVHAYALTRLPQSEPSMAVAGPGVERKGGGWGIIEID
ncbi:MAG: hypothetical protein AB7U83_21035 [Vicinamibacterales bacterium]